MSRWSLALALADPQNGQQGMRKTMIVLGLTCAGLAVQAGLARASESDTAKLCAHVRAYEHGTDADIEVWPIGAGKIVCSGQNHSADPVTFVTTDAGWWVQNAPEPARK